MRRELPVTECKFCLQPFIPHNRTQTFCCNACKRASVAKKPSTQEKYLGKDHLH